MKSLPNNWSNVSGGDWIPKPAQSYLLRFDWIPQVKEYHQWQENIRWWSDYAKNTGIDSSRIKYPYRSGFYSQTSGEQFYRTFQVSKNIMRLYR